MYFKKILIANRGEIALRVMRTCKDLGIATVAVYSEADSGARHVRFADEAYCIGPAASSESYLKMDNIIAVCKRSGAEAVHPGYGFLSENPEFARKLEANNIVLIGPSPEAMEMMGSKIASKLAVIQFDVPLVPGINEAVTDDVQAFEIARQIGFPVLVKASAGGGGKGMRVVHAEEEFLAAISTARNEARNAFGDDSVFIEKYMAHPRHIEFQVLADKFGNVRHLFERDCSIQRRHQKLVEEAPSAVLSPGLRKKMGEAAVNVARACSYTGAGTVEFLVSGPDFYFLEMNTRLQVEHPVTEMITGLDLVKEQIRIAAGEPIAFSQDEIKVHGHAIELRVCAEDPSNNFLPNVGRIESYAVPQGPGVRVDDCMEAGMDIPIYYDNMIAKLVVWGEDRQSAIQRMLRAIPEFRISGIETTLAFGEFVLRHPKFIEGDFDTHFIATHFQPSMLEQTFSSGEELALAAAATAFFSGQDSRAGTGSDATKPAGGSAWTRNRKSY